MGKVFYLNFKLLGFLQFSEFTAKDYKKLYGHNRGGKLVSREWILFGADRVLMQGKKISYDNCNIYLKSFSQDKSENSVRKLLESNLIPLDRLLVESDSPFMYPNTRASKLSTTVKSGLTERSLMFLHR